ncbi:MAG TPA: glycosyltransferase family 4 protein [Steroidobacteraceae bacterium]|nr:glycosyltransferase family 4 protein [Steroidobacteraceae bacterium]
MNADTRILERDFQPYAARLAPLPPDGRVRVLQFGPSLTVRGGITSVEQLICDYLPPYVSIRHVPTMEDGSTIAKAQVFAKAVQVLHRALESPEPTVVHIHFASRGSTLRKMILAEMVARAGRPLILHAHGSEFDDFHRRLPAAVRRNVNRTLQRANVFITLSTQWRDFYVDECEISASQVVVLANPVRVPAEIPDRSTHTQVQFLHLGRLGERKGSYDLVNAFLGLPDELRNRARLVLAGDGDVDGVRKMAAPAGDRIVVHSWIDTRERDRLLAESDVFALPSRAEGVPMALLEAMANGLPSITSPVGGIPDVFRDNVDGMLVKAGDVDQIRAAMIKLISDDMLRLAAGRSARERARQYDVHVYARRLADIYQRIAPVAEVREIA